MTTKNLEEDKLLDLKSASEFVHYTIYMMNKDYSEENKIEKFKSPKKIQKDGPPKKIQKDDSPKIDLSKIEVHICVYCDDMFKTKEELFNHNKKRCVKIYKCKSCKKTFDRKKHIDDHRNRKRPCVIIEENLDYDFVCDVCNKGYSSKKNLNIHKKTCMFTKESMQKRKTEILKKELEEEKQIEIFKTKIAKKTEKSENKYKMLTKMNNLDNKNLFDFNSKESTFKRIREKLTDHDLTKISNLFYENMYKTMAKFILKKLHYSEDYPQGNNIKYLQSYECYMVYENNKWTYKFSEETILDILQREVEWGINLSLNLLDEQKKCKLSKQLREKYNKFVENEYKVTQTALIEKIQKKHEKENVNKYKFIV